MKIGRANTSLIIANLHTLPKWEENNVYKVLAMPKLLACKELTRY